MVTKTMPDLKLYPDPALGPAEVQLKRGLNLYDNLLEMDREDAAILKNMLWVRNTLQRRRGFQLFSTESWAAITKWRGACEFIDRWGNRRVLLGTDIGKIVEYQSASTHADIVTGLNTQQDIYFAKAFGAAFVINGQNTPKRIDGGSVSVTPCTQRDMGPPVAIANVALAAGVAGAPSGVYLGIVTAVREESGVKVLESDWSNIATVTVTAQKLVFTWNASADSRVTHYYIYHTNATGSVMYYAGKVTVGTNTFTDNTADSAIIANPPAPLQYRNGAPPIGKYIVASGGRIAILNLSTAQNGFQCSAPSTESYTLENFPVYDVVNQKFYTGGNHLVLCPGDGPITAGRAIGETGERSARANNLWVAQEKSCYILTDTNPNNPLQEISSQVGCIGPRAHAQYGQGIFFQSRRGVEFWPGNGKIIYLISDQINPVFVGGGNQNLTANQSDADITYEVDGNNLLITVRDDAAKTVANKVYILDLLNFMKNFQGFVGPGAVEGAALGRWSGPWQNNGYGLFLALSNGSLLLLDNQDVTLLQRSTTSYQDWVGGANKTADIRILAGPAMKEIKMLRNKLHWFDLFVFSNTDSSLRIIGENGAYDQSGIAVVATVVNFNWADILWQDITWEYDTWRAETCLPWSAIANFWQFDITNMDSSGDFVFYGYALRYTSVLRTRTFR